MTKVLVTGSNGLVGSAIKKLSNSFDGEFYFATRQDGDLTKDHDVFTLYEKSKPDIVIHTAAKVGGIGGNLAQSADYFYDNIMMNAHMLHHARLHGVKKMLVFSSICAMPCNISLLKESDMHDGPVFEANFAYGYAKRMVDVQITGLKQQYGVKCYSSIIPGNIFGPHDLYSLSHGHVLPSLIHKIFLAKKDKVPLKVWGDGSALREFIYSEDLARFMFDILRLDDIPQRVLISGNHQVSIKQVVEMLCDAANFDGGVIWQTDKPNGQAARRTDLSLLKSLVGDLEYTEMSEALAESYKWFEDNYPNVRM